MPMRITPALSAGTVLSLLLSIPVDVTARTWIVTHTPSSSLEAVRDAVEAADSGDTVLVTSGEYPAREFGTHIRIAKSLVLKGVGAQRPTLRATTVAISVTQESLRREQVHIEYLSIVADDIGIELANEATITQNIIDAGRTAITVCGFYVRSPQIHYNALLAPVGLRVRNNSRIDTLSVDATHNWWNTIAPLEIAERVQIESYHQWLAVVRTEPWLATADAVLPGLAPEKHCHMQTMQGLRPEVDYVPGDVNIMLGDGYDAIGDFLWSAIEANVTETGVASFDSAGAQLGLQRIEGTAHTLLHRRHFTLHFDPSADLEAILQAYCSLPYVASAYASGIIRTAVNAQSWGRIKEGVHTSGSPRLKRCGGVSVPAP